MNKGLKIFKIYKERRKLGNANRYKYLERLILIPIFIFIITLVSLTIVNEIKLLKSNYNNIAYILPLITGIFLTLLLNYKINVSEKTKLSKLKNTLIRNNDKEGIYSVYEELISFIDYAIILLIGSMIFTVVNEILEINNRLIASLFNIIDISLFCYSLLFTLICTKVIERINNSDE